MSAEVLRRAASLMRERAEAATPGPWVPHVRSVQPEATHPHVGWVSTIQNRQTVVDSAWDGDVAYIASMHPAVALAVADWLDGTAKWLLPCEEPCWERGIDGCPDCEIYGPALAVARAYLGDQS